MRLPIRLMVVPARMKPLASHHSHNAMEPVWFRLSTFANGLTNNKDGFTSLPAVIAPNLMVKPPTIMFNKVTTKDAKQAVQMFGPAQHAVAKAVADSVAEGVIPRDQADDLFICVGVFIHWHAANKLSCHQGSDCTRHRWRPKGCRGHRETQPSLVKHPFAA
jgi:5,6,7,8-tetrahydromethanopterin hydro-lyase